MSPSTRLSWGVDSARLRRFGPYVLYGLVTLLAIVLYLDNHRFFATVDLNIQDTMVSLGRRPEPPSGVVVVNIDDNAVAKLGPWPWDSERVGYLVGMLTEYHPRAIGLDLELPEALSEDPVGNRFLAEMITRAGNVVLPLRFTLTDIPRAGAPSPDYVGKSALIVVDEAARLLDLPYPSAAAVSHPYAEACRAAWGMGHINTWQDVDGTVRRDPLLVVYQGDYYPSMPLQLVRVATGINRTQAKIVPGEGVLLGGQRIPTDATGMMRIDYRGPTGTVPSVSAARVLEGQVDSTALMGKIVVVGVTASGYGTALRTSTSTDMPRAEKIATVAANILDEHYLRAVHLSTLLDLAVLVSIGAFCAVVLPRVTLLYRVVVLLVMAFACLNLNYVLYTSFKLVTNTLYPTLEIFLFLLFAPAIKPHRERATEAIGATPRIPRRSVKRVPAGGPPVLAATVAIGGTGAARRESPPRVDADGLPVRHVRENAPVGAISGPAETVPLDIPAAAPPPAPGTNEDQGISMTPVFEPPESQPSSTAMSGTQVRDMMNESPHPMGLLDDEGSQGATAQRGTDPELPKRLGRYEILGVLGEGAMGTVLKGKDPAIDRLVALKIIRTRVADPAQAAELRERLIREAKAAGKLSHPNIVTIYDVGTEGDVDYIAMEYLEGYTLEQIVRKQVQLNYRIVAKMLMQVCRALDYAHRGGIVHRDIKPANIMVLEDFDVKVTDFGIARFESAGMSMTQTGVTVGTPYYISPEQLRGGAIDRRCDLFSLGVVAYELLTRRRPFDGENITALIYAITQTNPDPPSRYDPNVPGLFDMIIGKALAKDPRERYQSAEEMAHDLSAFVEDMVAAKPLRI